MFERVIRKTCPSCGGKGSVVDYTEKTYALGDVFWANYVTSPNEYHVIAVMPSGRVCAVGVSTGIRASDEKPVKDLHRITEAEMSEIFSGAREYRYCPGKLVMPIG